MGAKGEKVFSSQAKVSMYIRNAVRFVSAGIYLKQNVEVEYV